MNNRRKRGLIQRTARLHAHPRGGKLLGGDAQPSLTPSAVSKLITRLETRLDVRPVDCSGRPVVLTPQGGTFTLAALHAISVAEEAEVAVTAGNRITSRSKGAPLNSIVITHQT